MVDHSDLEYIIHHVFLTPKLPQEDDCSAIKSAALTNELLKALKAFQSLNDESKSSEWATSIDMVSKMLKLRDHAGGLLIEEVETGLETLKEGGSLALLIRRQNAGLIVRNIADQYSFESFEVSPTNDAVMTCKGRLRRCFPGPAVAISKDRVENRSFREALAKLLVQLDTETPKEMWPTVSKAGSNVIEIRDTVKPGMITEMLTGILRAIGQPFNVPRIHKRTRDDVLWNNAFGPWRRSPLWLFLRVALQTNFQRYDLEDKSYLRYKSFMVFFMSRVLETALQAAFPSDILFAMSAKISNRAMKLGNVNQTAWVSYTQKMVANVQRELNCRWREATENSNHLSMRQNWEPSKLNYLHDTKLSLSNLRPYLQQIKSWGEATSNHCSFEAKCSNRVLRCSSILPDLGLLESTDASNTAVFLADLELWVQDHLNGWLSANIENDSACTAIARLIDTYTSMASHAYRDKPEQISLMILNTMDMWIALDTCALRHCHLLQDYDPGFPQNLFEPLILSKKHQLERLLRIEQYLTRRREAVLSGTPSILQSNSTKMDFAVRYFQQSPRHKELRVKIEKEAATKRSYKLSELADQHRRYNQLLGQSNAMCCEYVSWNRKGRQYTTHSYSCEKCRILEEARGISIDVHEHPLPSKDLEAKSAVFELAVPVVVSDWRNITYSILIDILSSKLDKTGQHKVYDLFSYTGLASYVQCKARRLQLASTTKSFVKSHYRCKNVAEASESNICVKNGLRYLMYDSSAHNFTQGLLGHCDVREKCTLKLPAGPYQQMQFAVANTIHTSNEIIANQTKCPATLTMHEFYAFATLRSGYRLQWRNIVRELAAQVLNFRRDETNILIAQTIWQAGPCDEQGACRGSHVDLEESGFGLSLLSTLEDAFASIEGNWQGATAARTFISLVTRLLSISSNYDVHEGCFQILRKARQITLTWSRQLNQKLQEGQDENEFKVLTMRTLEMVLSCCGTYEVDHQHLLRLLNSPENIAVLTECSIIVHDRSPVFLDGISSSIQTLLQRNWRLLHLAEPILREQILKLQDGLDITIGRLWAGYRPGIPWTALAVPNERWLITETSCEGTSTSMPVHYNVLDGSLLVNGLPLTGLPRSYQSHPSYCRLFGEKVLDVFPSTMAGMVFETKNEFCGYQVNMDFFETRLFLSEMVHFRMQDSELIIRAKKHEEIYQFLPVHALKGDFPQAFVQQYAHWLEVNEGLVEWRPLSNAWESSLQNWRMQPTANSEYILARGTSKLIDIHSNTAKAVLSILNPLELTTHIHIIVDEETKFVDVHLPRLKLDFFLRKDAPKLESKQFRGMTIDANQAFGTLIGLRNKLVLKGDDGMSRIVLIPHGGVSFQPDGHHVCVRIDTAALDHVMYSLYQVNHQLRRLTDNGSLKSKLYKCYMHALTAHCLTDELTGRTGTEEALLELAASSTHSFFKLEQEEIKLLELIAQLTPQRQFYPKHLRVMQQVKWTKLAPLSQHYSFHKVVRSLFEQAQKFEIFQHEPSKLSKAIIDTDEHLNERAAIRDSAYRVHNFGAEDHTVEHDNVYLSRHDVSHSSREHQTFSTAKLVEDWSSDLIACPKLLHEVESWGKPLELPQTNSPFPLGYDKKWLDKPATFFPSIWRALQHTLSETDAAVDKYNIMIMLSTMAYSKNAKPELVQTLLAFATVPELRSLRKYHYPLLQLSYGYEPDKMELFNLTMKCARGYETCPESHLPQLLNETWADTEERRKDGHQIALEGRTQIFVDFLTSQWPRETVSAPVSTDCNTYISMYEALKAAQNLFQIWYSNSQYREFVGQAQQILNRLNPRDEKLQLYYFLSPSDDYNPKQGYISFNDITAKPAPKIPPSDLKSLDSWTIQQREGARDHDRMRSLLTHLSSEVNGGYEQTYINDLRKSFNSLHEEANFKLDEPSKILDLPLENYLEECNDYVNVVFATIRRHFIAETSKICQLVGEANMGPRLSPTSLLHHLARGRAAALNNGWKRCLVDYALAISTLQRAERLFACQGNPPELLSELRNPGHDCWDPMQYPDWLLFEIENNILIRSVQAKIALEMISPSSGANSIMQLNMGEGKSSVIVPIVTSALANGEKLIRVVVLRQLSTQMFQLLAKKLGGLLGRRIFYMPFSRSLRLEVSQAVQIQDMYEECMHTGGVLLVQPEHLLSFELMGPERLLAGNSKLGDVLIATQRWLEERSRDILDESDEILSVRFELIYTIGIQRMVEFSPNRWVIIEHVLKIVHRCAGAVLDLFPEGLTLRSVYPGDFPRIRILQSLAGEKLMEMVAREICDSGLPGVPVWNFPHDIRDTLFRFLTCSNLDKEAEELLNNKAFSVESIKKSLLLLKGLIAGGVLQFVFKHKRWRVNYGLDLSRTMLAVPYRAKDDPAARAEFSHPDATIVLTCLSYYYGGLSDSQLYASFETLFSSDDAQGEYERWVQDAPKLPEMFRQLTGVNLRDITQCSQQVFPALRFAKNVIDFYMSQIVFPKEMKEFPHKLSASGWDIARLKSHPTTGSSGTNDSRYILPLTISQCDFSEQLHTNATQLDCILRSENSFIKSDGGSIMETIGAESLLQLIEKLYPPVRVILDVGAQVLEMQNEQVARTWLSRVSTSKAQASIFFDDENELNVLTRDGIIEPLMISPFAKQMDQCLIYLDEAHTRGTDLKLPTNYRAIVTLGPDLIKDRLVQACMRMRKLGKGQSVVFCAPTEVESKILACSRKTDRDAIGVEDVLRWSISETHIYTRKCIPLWATQGIRQQRRHVAWSQSVNSDQSGLSLSAAKLMLEPEAQSLQNRYGSVRQGKEQLMLQTMEDQALVAARREQIGAIQAKCQDFEFPSFTSANFQEEQERELSPENEAERQIELPPSLEPCMHSVHPDVKQFIEHGALNQISSAFQPAFKSLGKTSASEYLEIEAWPDSLLITTDFCQTVQGDDQLLDSYLRPVQWIASNKMANYVILSPHEAHELLPSIREHRAVTLHIYSPRTNMFVRTLENLSFCAVPEIPKSWVMPSIVTQLNLFTGQLYLRNYEEYLSLCRFLGLCFHPPRGNVQVSHDGFVRPADRATFDMDMMTICPFKNSPVEFLRVLIALRRKGQRFTISHLGRILQGDLLKSDQFE